MSAFFKTALMLCWLVLLIYWGWSALRAKPVARNESRLKQLLVYWLPLAIAVFLLGPGHWFGHSWLREQFVPHTTPVFTIALVLSVAGTVVAIWARHQLGRNWSGNVQIKQEHTLITAGPYTWVRHPIYSGLLLLFCGTALMVGDWRGVIAVAIVFASFWFKLRQEECFLAEHFGAPYLDYARRTKLLIPGLL
ncbi:isoprenylcysteine carboxylmethyltransferase family protein [Stenotrophomonas sp. Iso1]|uniref:methyltransferase family protein n=1 Tax=Stenotrophomonas sp. Iso1 TaxID=2977283 RepID=UPI0022B7A34C|nr:isoprenylcysteine carboxylmethyltransferase family protein [Stenotrophomonas sp. Iso1]